MNKLKDKEKLKNDDGFVLVLVMIILVVVVSLSAGMASMVHSHINFVSNEKDRTQALYLAESGIEYSKTILLDNTEWRWNNHAKKEYMVSINQAWWKKTKLDGFDKLEIRKIINKKEKTQTIVSIANYKGTTQKIETTFKILNQISPEEIFNSEDRTDFSVTKFNEEVNYNITIKNKLIEDKNISISSNQGNPGIKADLEKITFKADKFELDLKNNTSLKDIVIIANKVDIKTGNKVDFENVFIFTDNPENVKINNKKGEPVSEDNYIINPTPDDSNLIESDSSFKQIKWKQL